MHLQLEETITSTIMWVCVHVSVYIYIYMLYKALVTCKCESFSFLLSFKYFQQLKNHSWTSQTTFRVANQVSPLDFFYQSTQEIRFINFKLIELIFYRVNLFFFYSNPKTSYHWGFQLGSIKIFYILKLTF